MFELILLAAMLFGIPLGILVLKAERMEKEKRAADEERRHKEMLRELRREPPEKGDDKIRVWAQRDK